VSERFVCLWMTFHFAGQEKNGAEHPPATEPVVREVLDANVPQLLGDATVDQYNEAWIARNGKASIAHRLAAAQMLQLLRPGERDRTLDLLVGPGNDIGTLRFKTTIFCISEPQTKCKIAQTVYSCSAGSNRAPAGWADMRLLLLVLQALAFMPIYLINTLYCRLHCRHSWPC
jgi:hypothetical protein